MKGVAIGITEDGDSLDSQLLGGTHDSASNLTTIMLLQSERVRSERESELVSYPVTIAGLSVPESEKSVPIHFTGWQ